MPQRGKRSLNGRQERFCQLFIACGIASKAFKDAGYRWSSENAATTHAARLVANGRINARLLQLRSKIDAKLEISKDRLIERFWDIVHDPGSKRGEAVAAGIALAKMVGWNAPTRIEHDLGDRVRSYLEDIRAKPLRPIPTLHSHSVPLEATLVEVERVTEE